MRAWSLALLFLVPVAHAQTTIDLYTPHTVYLDPAVSTFRCAASTATTAAYKSVVTGFSADGNYVLGQVNSTWVCGSSGRGGGLYYYHVCTYLQWDLSGNLVSVNTPTNGRNDALCPTVTFSAFPSTTPPSNSVIGNEFTNAGGYTAETVISEACGSQACYATYYQPTLVTP